MPPPPPNTIVTYGRDHSKCGKANEWQKHAQHTVIPFVFWTFARPYAHICALMGVGVAGLMEEPILGSILNLFDNSILGYMLILA